MLDPFKNITTEGRIALFKELESMTYHFSKNTSVLSSIMLKDILGIVIEGSLQIIKTDYNGNRTIVETISQNSLFGSAISSLNDNNYELITQEESTIIIFDYSQLVNYSQLHNEDYNQFIRNLFEIMNHIITMRNERIRILTQKSIRNKLLEYFDVFAKKYDSRNVYLPFSFTDLADYLAVDRSAMSREIKHLKDENIISVKSRKITLLYK